uniref:Uncharacterized protein n=1 Tax=Anguilla anguilla TaxID=7936 RepID=A0A0E9P9T9_ANGAN
MSQSEILLGQSLKACTVDVWPNHSICMSN